MQSKKGFVVAITGASGAIYAFRLLKFLSESGFEVHLTASENGRKVFKHEMGTDIEKLPEFFPRVKLHRFDDMFSPLASGSFLTKHVRAVFVVPCSVGTLGHVANGAVSNLIHRVCDVAIKEGLPLVMAVREMPLSAIHLKNMLKLQRLGVKAFPISPGFYHRPQNLEQLVDFAVGKILDQVGIEHNLYTRWGEGFS
jgi:4-hydroxy-3-polyprenylbenzoate decarboxylase